MGAIASGGVRVLNHDVVSRYRIPKAVIDDGLATGFTVKAAVEAVRAHRPSRIVVAVPDEEAEDERTAQYRFDISFLGERVVGAVDWFEARSDLRRLPLAFLGASTGAAAALIAAAARPGGTRSAAGTNRERR